jgi:DNA-binding NarL/FixJ family response regulator
MGLLLGELKRLTNEARAELEKLARSKCTSVRLVQRAQIVLLAAQGLQNKDIAW